MTYDGIRAVGRKVIRPHSFLNAPLDRHKWSMSRPDRLTPGERAPDTSLIELWVEPRDGLDVLENQNNLLTLLLKILQPLA